MHDHAMPRRYFSIDDVAEIFGVTARLVRKWIDHGELAAINVGRTKHSRRPLLRISREALERFEKWRSDRDG